MRIKQTFTAVVGLLLIALLLSACSGDSSSESPNSFTVAATEDFTYSPDTISVAAGQEVTLTFNNEGSVEHSLNILNSEEELEHVLEEAHEEEELHEELALEIHEIEPGASETKTFTAPAEAGDYIFFCSLPGHAEEGLVGTLTVTP
jgi:uncharacterized cupredoxin-like copper-binding protein